MFEVYIYFILNIYLIFTFINLFQAFVLLKMMEWKFFSFINIFELFYSLLFPFKQLF
jgi:hypothetical protein